MWHKLNIVLVVAFAASLGLNLTMVRNPSRRNLEVFPDMAHPVSYESFSANPHFSDGKTMRDPVPGTLPRGVRALHYAATPEDRVRAGKELKNPFSSADPAAVNRGTAVFLTFCVPCHGASGKGDGLVAQRGYPPPASLVVDRARQLRDGEMFHVMTYGQNNMPSYAAQISDDDRWKAILFVRSLQKGGK